MRVRKAARLALTLFVTAAMGVSGYAAAGQTATHAKTPTVKHRAKTRHARYSSRRSRRERGQKAPTSDRISEIQSALTKDGSFDGTPNGKWDGATVEAMKKFQDSHGLNPTGKLDAKTLQKLGLGSQTAGIAPPMPPVSSTSLTTTPAAAVPRLP
ncbi:MAG: peptidoglycan-binding domain-containing protein [Candidatus Acidiferrum sp.]